MLATDSALVRAFINFLWAVYMKEALFCHINLNSRSIQYEQCDVTWTHHIIVTIRHDDRYGASNHRHSDHLLNRLFRRRSKKTSKLRVIGPATGRFPSQMASSAENGSIWWRHHDENPTQYTNIQPIPRIMHTRRTSLYLPIDLRVVSLVLGK